jgi:CRP-like cAMP-binding protein
MSNYVIRHDRRIEVESLETGKKPRPRAEPFVQVPLSWAVKAAKATKTKKALVWIELLYVSWRTKTTTFPLSNERLDGVTRYTKYRALRELEAEGLITVKRQRKKSPVVTLIR